VIFRAAAAGSILAIVICNLAPLAAADQADFPQRLIAPFAFVASGSGVVVSAAGEILTNHHVIADVCSPLEPKLTVRLAQGGEWAARLVATDPIGDLALLQLDPGFPTVVPARLAQVVPAVGAVVFAVGNPFALGDLDDRPALSRGVLSTGRVVRGTYADCLQHDAPVNPGNSGGPLFTEAGALLGINGAIRSRSGFRINSGIGLAIAAPQVARFLPALRAAGAGSGYVMRSAPPLGLRLVEHPQGTRVEVGSGPLQPGDVLLAVDGRPCPSPGTALGLFMTVPWSAGATLSVQFRRGTHEQVAEVALERYRIPGRAAIGLTVEVRQERRRGRRGGRCRPRYRRCVAERRWHRFAQSSRPPAPHRCQAGRRWGGAGGADWPG
jgi:S1-C subfamily serine protease